MTQTQRDGGVWHKSADCAGATARRSQTKQHCTRSTAWSVKLLVVTQVRNVAVNVAWKHNQPLSCEKGMKEPKKGPRPAPDIPPLLLKHSAWWNGGSLRGNGGKPLEWQNFYISKSTLELLPLNHFVREVVTISMLPMKTCIVLQGQRFRSHHWTAKVRVSAIRST